MTTRTALLLTLVGSLILSLGWLAWAAMDLGKTVGARQAQATKALESARCAGPGK